VRNRQLIRFSSPHIYFSDVRLYGFVKGCHSRASSPEELPSNKFFYNVSDFIRLLNVILTELN
jgi:hypothetical protein